MREILDDLSSYDQTHNRGNKSVAPRNLSALSTLPRRSWRADTVGTAADRHVVDRRDRRFLGINDL